uniref:DNA polymerase III subunit epsilon n=1 Tax=Heligmosomoides polygyrus TaxID=6339 RepID=A0A183GW23_HELPZ
LIRYVSDSAAAEERVPLPVDLNEVLKNLGETYETRLTSDQLKTCRKFREGRIRYEYYAAREDGLLEIPEDEREKYMLAERDVSKTIKAMVNILFEINPPKILCLLPHDVLPLERDKHGRDLLQSCLAV